MTDGRLDRAARRSAAVLTIGIDCVRASSCSLANWTLLKS